MTCIVIFRYKPLHTFQHIFFALIVILSTLTEAARIGQVMQNDLENLIEQINGLKLS